MERMKSMFITINQRPAGQLVLHLRAYDKTVALETVAVASKLTPDGYTVADYEVNPVKNTKGTGGNGRRRNVIVRFNRTGSCPPMQVPEARRHFARAWEVSRGPALAPSSPQSESQTAAPRTTAKS